MESYPGELLVGVFPLVFCVDAKVPCEECDITSLPPPPPPPPPPQPPQGESSSANDFDNPEQASNYPPPKPTSYSSSRSQFDRFLDAMAASLVDGAEDHPLSNVDNSVPRVRKSKEAGNTNTSSLFRVDDDEECDSDEEDNILLAGSAVAGRMSSTSGNFDASHRFVEDSMSSPTPKNSHRSIASIKVPSFRLVTANMNRANAPAMSMFGAGSRSDLTRTMSGDSIPNTSYAKSLEQDQGFFQQARIVPIGKRHGFPPSKDTSGEKGRISDYVNRAKGGLETSKLMSAIKECPIDGILPSGWLEKHSHALPSVLIVVVPVSCDKEQEKQDQSLLDTLENLRQSLAEKRGCTIYLVAVVQDNVNMIQAEQWSQSITETVNESISVTFLNKADLDNDAAPSVALKQLHKSVREASLKYYLRQARRNKAKLQILGMARKTPLCLPLSIRYCFKAAVFYEFQWKFEKSLKFMVETYRFLESYYRYLLERRKEEQSGRSPRKSNQVKILNTQESNASNSSPEMEDTETGESVELTLGTPYANGDTDVFNFTPPPPPPRDMALQCRAVADWINFKILQAGFSSHTEGGLLAASIQWQKHCQIFTSPKSFVSEPWHDWSYVSQQRLIVSQLLERHPPRALGEMGNDFDEVLLRCSPWRTYEAATEAMLKLGLHVHRAQTKNAMQSGTKVDDLRILYVGGLDMEGLHLALKKEARINHKEKALDCILRAINLFERDFEKEMARGSEDDNFQVRSWSRSGARMYYLAGGILSGLGRYAEAAPRLEKAARYAKGWNGLVLTIRRMLIECYDRHMPSQSSSQEVSSQTLASMLLDSYFNAEISNSQLRQALEKFSSLRGCGAIKWYRDCIDEADSSLPFSFAMTFPSITHATAGDSVKASVLIKSNLDYAVHINSVTLVSMAGEITIPSSDLLSARNANEGRNGGIIIQANTEVLISTQIGLPKDLNQIAIDETGNGGQTEGVAGKGSFAKSAKPRSGGITAAAGSRLVSEKQFGGGVESRPGNSQWSLCCIGGKPLRCDGIRLLFYPVYAAAAGEGNNCEIELTIEKKQPKTNAKIRRTPFEEDNYISSAWMRPRHLPLSRGPRCLRVLPPMADMIISNLTEIASNGKALEGTVNRILLKLSAGQGENCTDVRFRVNCSSLLLTPEGISKSIVRARSEDDGEESTENMMNPRVRSPVLVTPNPSAPSHMIEYGYEIPAGWSLLGDGGGMGEALSEIVPILKSGDSTYAYFHIFRPSPTLTRMDGILQVDEDAADLACEQDMCKTDIDVYVRYRQERKIPEMKKSRRRNRKKPNATSSSGDRENTRDTATEEELKVDEQSDPDLVCLEYNTSVLWCEPISATFSPAAKQTFPSGNRHPSNAVLDPGTAINESVDQDTELVLIDGERVMTKCVLEAAGAADGLTIAIERILFDDNNVAHAPCQFCLLSGKKEKCVLLQTEKAETCRMLKPGSKFTFSWLSEVRMKPDYLKGSVSSFLGTVKVEWTPTPLQLPESVESLKGITTHGPLTLAKPSTCRFMGPPCYIENAPFETTVESSSPAPQIAVPFDVVYCIRNKTAMEQRLRILLDESGDDNDGFLISGLVNGEVTLNPFETHTLTYTALAKKTGRSFMPQVSVISERFRTWVIRDKDENRRSIFVLP